MDVVTDNTGNPVDLTTTQETMAVEPINTQPVQQPANNWWMFIVLGVLVLLMVLVHLWDRMRPKSDTPAEEDESIDSGDEPDEEPVIDEEPTVLAPVVTDDDADEVAAVIAAAVAMAMEDVKVAAVVERVTQPEQVRPVEQPVNGLLVRLPRKKSGAVSAWNRAGREEQVYSHI